MNIILYTIGCPQCIALEHMLDVKNIKYDIVEDVGVMQNKGIQFAPALEVDGEIMNMYNATKWLQKQ